MKSILSLIFVFFTLLGPKAQAATNPGFHDDSGAGVVVTTGNSRTQSFNFSQLNTYGWDQNLLKFEGKYLTTSSNDTLTTKKWNLGIRYEREITAAFNALIAESIESDLFSGYNQRYNTDLGASASLIKESAFEWSLEAGYRYTIENRLAGQVKQNYSRLFTEASRKFNAATALKLNFEYLQNFTVTADHQLNSELSLAAILNETFSIKTAYLVKYRSILPAPATQNTDTQFLTSLVAKF